MAIDIADLSPIPASNTTIDSLNIAEGCDPGNLNGVDRSIAAALAAFHRRVTFFDDFLGGAIEARISSTAGSGTGNQAATVVADSLNGEITIKSASDNGAHSANATTITLDQLNFKANQGGMAVEARLKVDLITSVALFLGFTDVISTTVEMPIYKASGADDIDSDAADACGICFDTQGTTDQWFHGGVKAGVDTAATHSGTAPSADTHVTLRVEVSAAGAVVGYVNDTAIGSAVANAVTITTSLTPCIVICNRTTSQRIATIDYFYAQQSRIA